MDNRWRIYTKAMLWNYHESFESIFIYLSGRCVIFTEISIESGLHRFVILLTIYTNESITPSVWRCWYAIVYIAMRDVKWQSGKQQAPDGAGVMSSRGTNHWKAASAMSMMVVRLVVLGVYSPNDHVKLWSHYIKIIKIKLYKPLQWLVNIYSLCGKVPTDLPYLVMGSSWLTYRGSSVPNVGHSPNPFLCKDSATNVVFDVRLFLATDATRLLWAGY